MTPRPDPRRRHGRNRSEGDQWLFPGRRPGQPMDPTTWATGCGGWASNLAPPAILTLLQLGAELPSIVLADLLGIISAPPNAGTPPQVPAGAATPPDQPRLRRKRHERRTRESGTSSTRMALPSSAPQWPEVSRALIVQRPDRVSGHRVRLHTADDLLRDTLGALHLGFRSL